MPTLFVVEFPSMSILLLNDLASTWKTSGCFTTETLVSFEGVKATRLHTHILAWTTGFPPTASTLPVSLAVIVHQLNEALSHMQRHGWFAR
jgi:hypothetical protein